MRRMIDWLVGRLGDAGRVLLLLWLLIAIGLISLVVPACVQLTHGNWAGALTVVGVRTVPCRCLNTRGFTSRILVRSPRARTGTRDGRYRKRK
jgi:hypothetical protein